MTLGSHRGAFAPKNKAQMPKQQPIYLSKFAWTLGIFACQWIYRPRYLTRHRSRSATPVGAPTFMLAAVQYQHIQCNASCLIWSCWKKGSCTRTFGCKAIARNLSQYSSYLDFVVTLPLTFLHI